MPETCGGLNLIKVKVKVKVKVMCVSRWLFLLRRYDALSTKKKIKRNYIDIRKFHNAARTCNCFKVELEKKIDLSALCVHSVPVTMFVETSDIFTLKHWMNWGWTNDRRMEEVSVKTVFLRKVLQNVRVF
jgi:hypothetical protein